MLKVNTTQRLDAFVHAAKSAVFGVGRALFRLHKAGPNNPFTESKTQED